MCIFYVFMTDRLTDRQTNSHIVRVRERDRYRQLKVQTDGQTSR